MSSFRPGDGKDELPVGMGLQKLLTPAFREQEGALLLLISISTLSNLQCDVDDDRKPKKTADFPVDPAFLDRLLDTICQEIAR